MTLLTRLRDIGSGHSGAVQLHGRLFAQWMHHAFPRECAYPHVSGTTNPLTPDELEATGEDTTATQEEMQTCITQAENQTQELSVDSLPWSPEEELLTVRPVSMQHSGGNTLLSAIRNVLMFAIMATVIYSLMRAASDVPSGVS